MSSRMIATGIALVAMLAACSSAAPAGSTPLAATLAPGASSTPLQVTTAPVVTTVPVGTTPPATAPGASQQPLPSFAGDPELAAQFPTQVGGHPVTNVNTFRLVDWFRANFASEAQIDGVRQTLATVGIDMDTAVWGVATIGENQDAIEAFRVPGQDASKLIPIVAANWEGNPVGYVASLETIGGKSVAVDTRSSPALFMYGNGDILWLVHGGDAAGNAAYFAALP